MKKMFLTAAMMLASVATFAQNAVGQITIQPKVGLNIANVTDADDADARIGLAAGAEFEYGVTDMIGVSAGLIYSMQGAKEKVEGVDLAIPVGVSYQYQNIVLDARYNWGVTKIMDDVDSKNSVFQITLGYKFAL